jgi:hypothetical protein
MLGISNKYNVFYEKVKCRVSIFEFFQRKVMSALVFHMTREFPVLMTGTSSQHSATNSVFGVCGQFQLV